ncbi:hypothetical protein [Fundidesulfovibrio terrae]|uniref:hypothetical protein n=1 Tax=Fundidesulfovibrio terrae TaxID=2922866 RepID=UPI001FAF913F|nr:hypothetical protein [Fundidesulfovibrio terrae]
MRERVETLFGKLAQSDPLYKGTIQMMEHHLELLSPSLRRMVRGMFARCPHEALGVLQGDARGSREGVQGLPRPPLGQEPVATPEACHASMAKPGQRAGRPSSPRTTKETTHGG